MTSSNTIAESGLAVAPPADAASAAVDDGAATASPTAASPFELLPTGEAFGVCDLDGECS